MCGWKRSASTPRTRAAWSSRSWRTSSPATSNTNSPPGWKRTSTASPTARSTGARCCATSGATSSARSTASRTCASARCSTCSTRCSRRICSRRARTAPIRASARPAATAGSALKLGRFGAFIGCSNYPECQFTRQLAANGAASADKVLGKDPDTGLDVAIKTGRFGTYLQLGEAEGQGREAEARRHPEGLVARRHHARKRAQAALAAARGRQEPGGRRADPGRHRPVRPLRAARQDLREPRLRARTCSPSGSTARSR